jgi:DNA invertase Pin-like site-specific DNA recombinase
MVGYVRVSTLGQVRDGLGLADQERRIRAWVKANGHKLTALVTDDAKTGTLSDTDRPGLLEALSSVKGGQATAIVITDLGRWSRLLTVQEAVLAQVWGMGGQVFTTDHGEVLADDPEDPMRTAMRQMAGVFYELDRKLVIKRLRNGRLTKAAKGGHAVGRAPYGWKAEGRQLVPDHREQQVIARMMGWADEDVSLAEISRRLTSEGVPAKAGGNRWHPITVRRTLERARKATV